MVLEESLPAIAPGTGGMAELQVSVSRKMGGGGPKVLRPITIPMRVQADLAGNLTGCGKPSSRVMMLSTPVSLPPLSWMAKVPCGRKVDVGVKLDDHMRVPSGTTHVLLTSQADINVWMDNIGAEVYAGPTVAGLIKVIDLDSGTSPTGPMTEANASSYNNIPVRVQGTSPSQTHWLRLKLQGICQSGTLPRADQMQGSARFRVEGFLVPE